MRKSGGKFASALALILATLFAPLLPGAFHWAVTRWRTAAPHGIVVAGRITDERNRVIEHATISVVGEPYSSQTVDNGTFRLDLPRRFAEKYVRIAVQANGFMPALFSVTLPSSENPQARDALSIQLRPEGKK